MKVLIVLALVVAVSYANNIGRATGWGSPSRPSINLDLSAAAAAVAAGQAQGGQGLLESAVGTIDIPAYIASLNGVGTQVGQAEDISQVQAVNKPLGATSTINAVDTINLAEADDNLEGSIGGGLAAIVTDNAETSSSGQGAIAAEDSTTNLVQSKTH